MQLEYFSLPLELDKLIRQRELPKCSLQQSVTQHLHLLLTTGFGEFPGDESFGCAIWDNDFDNVTGANKLKEIIRQSLLTAIRQHEKRIGDLRVDVSLVQEELPESSTRRVKKKIDIVVNAILHSTNEKLTFKDSFFIGPFSY